MQDLFSQVLGEEGPGWFPAALSPNADVSETDHAVEVRMDLPGIKPEEIEIHLSNNLLTVSGERKEEKEEKGKTFHRVERRMGSFSRSIMLPCCVQESKVDAKYKDGVLSISRSGSRPETGEFAFFTPGERPRSDGPAWAFSRRMLVMDAFTRSLGPAFGGQQVPMSVSLSDRLAWSGQPNSASCRVRTQRGPSHVP
jgi:HSP20 family protein